ncbi:NAD(P)-binding Rossmann-fold superfamily protein [Zea mays]|uniref:NAD(P)-binding Rossmann-fold superfamily protein n=1 Tax=Zea mays TaxID=4577 RepID=A0A1D6EGJ2_MAIZE|nr:NAD(P)-binding Rossmann-fold superfamily protein [Zea mays]
MYCKGFIGSLSSVNFDELTCLFSQHIYIFTSISSQYFNITFKRDLKEWNIPMELCLDRSAWKEVIHVPEP